MLVMKTMDRLTCKTSNGAEAEYIWDRGTVLPQSAKVLDAGTEIAMLCRALQEKVEYDVLAESPHEMWSNVMCLDYGTTKKKLEPSCFEAEDAAETFDASYMQDPGASSSFLQSGPAGSYTRLHLVEGAMKEADQTALAPRWWVCLGIRTGPDHRPSSRFR